MECKVTPEWLREWLKVMFLTVDDIEDQWGINWQETANFLDHKLSKRESSDFSSRILSHIRAMWSYRRIL